MNSVPTSTYNAATCSCSNALKEADYTLSYTPQGDGSFTADSLTVSIAVYDSIALNAAYCPAAGAALPTAAATVAQAFAFNYAVTQSSTLGNLRSGNPGYIAGLPLLVSSGSNGLYQLVNQNGFRIYGGDN